jgi:hypothetical protein
MNKGGCKTGRVKESPDGGCKIGKKNAGAKKYKIIKQAKARQAKQEPEKKKTKFRVVKEAPTKVRERARVARQDARVSNFLGGIEDKGFVFNKKRIETDNAINAASIPTSEPKIGVLPQGANQMDFFALMNLLPTDIKQNIGGQVFGDKIADPEGETILYDMEDVAAPLRLKIIGVYGGDDVGLADNELMVTVEEPNSDGETKLYISPEQLNKYLKGEMVKHSVFEGHSFGKELEIPNSSEEYIDLDPSSYRGDGGLPSFEDRAAFSRYIGNLNKLQFEKNIFGKGGYEGYREKFPGSARVQLKAAINQAIYRHIERTYDKEEMEYLMDWAAYADEGYKLREINYEINEFLEEIGQMEDFDAIMAYAKDSVGDVKHLDASIPEMLYDTYDDYKLPYNYEGHHKAEPFDDFMEHREDAPTFFDLAYDIQNKAYDEAGYGSD